MTQEKKMVIGIDLGTTNSLVSFIKEGSPRIVPNERGNRMTPSVVFFKEDNRMIVGELAKNQAVLNSERTVSNVKLSMGKDRKYTIGEKDYAPAEISSFILKYLKAYAENYLGKEIEDVVITVPAYFDDRQRDDTLKAAELAGLNVLKLLNEPTAAALMYGFSQKKSSRLLVIDFGGGTLDITLMEYKEKNFKVRGIGGSTSIGGTNFDQAVVEYILKDFEASYGIDLRKDRIAYQQLVIHAEKAKSDLSSTEETRMMIPYITATEKGPIHLNIPLSKDVLKNLISPILEEIRAHICQTFQQANLEPGWVETVILAGGSTRVPAIEELVREILNGVQSSALYEASKQESGTDQSIQVPDLNHLIKKNINPDEAVARGAAILAGILEGSLNNIEFHDITPHDMGVENDQGEFVTLLSRGTIYPAEVSRLFTTTQDYQEEVCIHILQQVVTNNNQPVSLGWFSLKIKEPKKKGESNIDVTFAIDANGMLHVSAIDLDSGEHSEITIEKVIR